MYMTRYHNEEGATEKNRKTQDNKNVEKKLKEDQLEKFEDDNNYYKETKMTMMKMMMMTMMLMMIKRMSMRLVRMITMMMTGTYTMTRKLRRRSYFPLRINATFAILSVCSKNYSQDNFDARDQVYRKFPRRHVIDLTIVTTPIALAATIGVVEVVGVTMWLLSLVDVWLKVHGVDLEQLCPAIINSLSRTKHYYLNQWYWLMVYHL